MEYPLLTFGWHVLILSLVILFIWINSSTFLKILIGVRKAVDLVLWRNERASARFLVGATVLSILFEAMGYPQLTFVCRVLILSLLILFIWIDSAAFLKSVCSGSGGLAAGSRITTADSSADRMEVDEKPELFRVKRDCKEEPEAFGHVEKLWKKNYGSSTFKEIMEQAHRRLSAQGKMVSAGEGILEPVAPGAG